MLSFVGAFVPNDQTSKPKQLDSSILLLQFEGPISRLNPGSFCDQQSRVFLRKQWTLLGWTDQRMTSPFKQIH